MIIQDRNAANKEKRIDTGIATDITADSYELMKSDTDTITLVSGDGDYVPTVERLRKRGLKFDVAFWLHASQDLKNAASRFIDLNPYLDYLRLK